MKLILFCYITRRDGPDQLTRTIRRYVATQVQCNFFLKKSNTSPAKAPDFFYPIRIWISPPPLFPHQGCDHVSQLEETVREVRKKFPKGRGDESTDHATEYAKYKLQYCVFTQLKHGDIKSFKFQVLLPVRVAPEAGRHAAAKDSAKVRKLFQLSATKKGENVKTIYNSGNVCFIVKFWISLKPFPLFNL